jgi:hypothetical protein
MDTQSIINCLEGLRDKMTPEQIAKLEQLKKEHKKSTHDKLRVVDGNAE